MLSGTTMKCRLFNCIFSSSSQSIREISECLLVLAMYQWTKNSFFANLPWLAPPGRHFPCYLLCDEVLLPLRTSVLSTEGQTSSPLPSQGGDIGKWHAQMASPRGFKLARVISYYYENSDSHKCTRQHISECSWFKMQVISISGKQRENHMKQKKVKYLL